MSSNVQIKKIDATYSFVEIDAGRVEEYEEELERHKPRSKVWEISGEDTKTNLVIWFMNPSIRRLELGMKTGNMLVPKRKVV